MTHPTPDVDTKEPDLWPGVMPLEPDPPPVATVEPNHGRALAHIAVILIVAILLANVPLGELRTSLLHLAPEATSVVIRQGMLLQGSDSQVYLLQDHRLRPFSSPDVFEHFNRRHHLRVQSVADPILHQFGRGQPIYRLVKCAGDPTVYAIEAGHKRPLTAPPTASNSRWDTVAPVTCAWLDEFPIGSPLEPPN